MIDVSNKEVVLRRAKAEGRLTLQPGTIEAIREGTIKKGDPFKTAEAAALTAVKSTFLQIPHCHPLPITSAVVEFEIDAETIVCRCTVKAEYKTGVEMEALNGVTNALLTVWDMVKYLEKNDEGQYTTAVINGVRVLEKTKEAI
jgi:cyclic pyranopterin phosphate synthase